MSVLKNLLLKKRSKLIRRNKEGPLIMIKGTIQQEDKTIVNIYDKHWGT